VLATNGALMALCDTPTFRLKVARGTKHAFDCPGLVSLLAPYADPQTHVIIEEAQAMPGQGTRSICMREVGFGLWLGLLGALGLAHTRALAWGSVCWGWGRTRK